MTGRPPDAVTLRWARLDLTSLGRALALSLAFHLFFWGTYATGHHFHWWEKVRLPAWVKKLSPPPLSLQAKPAPLTREPPLMFVDVSSLQAVTEVPKETKFYSDKNSVAANPEVNLDANAPKLDGSQTEVAKTEDAARKKFDQLMPDPPKPKPETETEAQPKPKLAPGTMTIAKAELKPQTEKARPRTIKEALLQRNQMPGQKAKLDAGAQQRPNASYDVKATGFGAYDRAFIDAVSSRWYDLLDSMSYDSYRSGRVVVQFNLNYDGRITEMKLVESTVTETLALLCQKAVLDPSPFKWPREMRLMIGEDSRRITFTFYYN
jgi:outer membrane biosynthesis protein TonB